MNVKASVERQFSSVAANYTTSPVHASGPDLAAMLSAAELRGDEVVLDVGCGPGHTALSLAPHVERVMAVDLSDEMLEEVRYLAGRRKIGNIETRKADVEKLPFERGSFDLVVTRYSAHHWPHPLRALAEFRRVLRDEGPAQGSVLLADIVSFDDFVVDTHIQTIELLRDPSHVRDHTATEWIDMFGQAKLDAQVVHEWRVRLAFDDWVERTATPPDRVDTIRSLLRSSPSEVRRTLRLEDDYCFTFRAVLLRAVRSAQ
jgi:ubiquinone/menaquinone biosynthesis C-methylase UbiE